MKCPNCESNMKEIKVKIQDADNLVTSYQCSNRGYFDFEEPVEEEDIFQEEGEEESRKSKLGDVNDDDKIDSGDAILLRRYLEGDGDLDNLQLFRSDVNQDGRVNPKDWKIILDYDAGLISKLPVSPNYTPSSQTAKEKKETSEPDRKKHGFLRLCRILPFWI